MTKPSSNPLIIGAGPAGLTAALRLMERGVTPRIFEAAGHVGGLACTPRVGEWRVDPGGHRFFTRSEEVMDLWKSLLPADQWSSVNRRSAMLVGNHFVKYPLRGRDLLTQMGYRRGLRGLSSLVWHRLSTETHLLGDAASFEEWGQHEFGRYWYEMFFDGYVRKTWLADPAEIASGWANQRIKPIGWGTRSGRASADQESYLYPALGPGQLWEAAAAVLADGGVTPSLNSHVTNIRFDGHTWTVEQQNGETATGDALFSSMPLRLLVDALEPAPPKHIRAVAASLRHRSLITVAVALRKRYDIPFNWVYTPGREFKVGRIQNYGRWSEALSPPDFDGTYLGFEYFTLPDDDLWVQSNEGLGSLVEHDLRALGIDSEIEHVMVVRSQFAYPIDDAGRDRSVGRIRDFLRREFPTLHPIGRNGMHRYDNQDHAMLSAMHSVDRYFGGSADPWQVNTDRGYHESGLLNS